MNMESLAYTNTREGLNNRDLIEKSADDFVDDLCMKALEHSAVQHPYLERLSNGDFPNLRKALQDLVFQYAFYSSSFTEYLEDVIDGITDLRHKELLTLNLREEEGIINETLSVSHRELFIKMQKSVGVDEKYQIKHQPTTTVMAWKQAFTKLCANGSEAQRIGAIGLGTEYVMPLIYKKMRHCFEEYTALGEDDYLFLTLHCAADEEHGETLRQIAVDLAGFYEHRRELQNGMMSALSLRAQFWDDMLHRATLMS